MPIVIPEGGKDFNFYKRLEANGSSVISEESATRQDMRPARIGLLNLMPGKVMEDTEIRWLRSISHTVLQIEPVLMKFDDDVRDYEGSSREQVLRRYQPFSEVADQGLDGLIITGDNQELREDGSLQPFDELYYHDDLKQISEWANENVPATIYSCLASHFELNRRYGVKRTLNNPKAFGVFDHDVASESSLVAGMDDVISAPHSRWGNVPVESLTDTDAEIIAVNERVGWLLAEANTAVGGLSTFIQGHPEYWRYDLHGEYTRDLKELPNGYYPDDNPEVRPRLSWANDSRALLGNWVTRIYNNYSL